MPELSANCKTRIVLFVGPTITTTVSPAGEDREYLVHTLRKELRREVGRRLKTILCHKSTLFLGDEFVCDGPLFARFIADLLGETPGLLAAEIGELDRKERINRFTSAQVIRRAAAASTASAANLHQESKSPPILHYSPPDAIKRALGLK